MAAKDYCRSNGAYADSVHIVDVRKSLHCSIMLAVRHKDNAQVLPRGTLSRPRTSRCTALACDTWGGWVLWSVWPVL